VASLLIKGQDSYGGNGGDLYFRAGAPNSGGFASLTTSTGGLLYLSPGASAGSGAAGQIVWGLGDHSLVVQGPQSATTINGQTIALVGQSSQTVGGDFVVQAGDGLLVAGSVNVCGGDAVNTAGSVIVGSGNSAVNGASNIFMLAGDGTNYATGVSVGGDVRLIGGTATQTAENGGSANVQAAGAIVILPSTSGFYIEQVATTVSSTVTISSNSGNTFTLNADAKSVLAFNGQTLVTSRPDELFLVLDVRDDTAENVSRLQDALITLINALGPCGHGLITYANPAGTVIKSCLVQQ